MTIVNPIIHMGDQFMWRWYETDDSGHMTFSSAKSFFYLEECRQDHVVAVQRIKRRA